MKRDDIQKEPSMVKQKDMMAGYFKRLARAKEQGTKVVYTFVPGNLAELILSFDLLLVYTEINALQFNLILTSTLTTILHRKEG